MKGRILRFMIMGVLLTLSACSDQMEDSNAEHIDLLTAFDFENGNQRWIGGISDFPLAYLDSAKYEIHNDVIPNSLSSIGKGLNISALNPHKELFYYFVRKESDLQPNQLYKVDFDFLVYTRLDEDPDGDVFLKIGATNFSPELSPKRSATNKDEEYIQLNVDKGEANSDSGTDVINIGSIKEFIDAKPQVISGNNFDSPIEVVSNKNGEIWLIIGVDSGISGELTFGMAAMTVYFRKKN